jgi:lysozyme
MNISDAGIQLIKKHEGCEFVAYKDIVGVLTIGYGHTGTDFNADTRWQQWQCDNALQVDLLKFQACVNKMAMVELTQNQFDALCSFAYNLGCNALANSSLMLKLNNGDVDGAAQEFLKWDHAGGHVVNGLLARREDEQALFMAA